MLPYSEFVAGSLVPLELLNVIFPYLFGGYPQSLYGLNYFGFAYGSHEVAAYAGLISLLLLLLLFLSKKSSRQAGFWLTWSLVATIMALGKYTPVAHLIFHIPWFNSARVPSRHTFEIALAIAILSGLGAKELFILEQTALKALIRRVTLITAAVVFVLVALLFFHSPP